VKYIYPLRMIQLLLHVSFYSRTDKYKYILNDKL
jgi:hypothetical protein